MLEVDGMRIELTRKRMRSARLGVRPDGTIRLSAPLGAGEARLVAFVREHRDWLLRQQSQQRDRQAPWEDLRNGGRVLLWERWHEVIRGHATRARATLGDGVVLLDAPDDAGAMRAVDRLRRQELEAAVGRIAPPLEERIGQQPAGYRYRAMTSRWGTCNTVTRWITVNTWLVQRSSVELEYLLAHELAHLVEAGHGARFQAVLDDAMPGWRPVRARLQSVLPPRR